jgi:hypothetical protein
MSKLLNEDLVQAKEKKYFDEGERSTLKDIIPAKDRVDDYKRKSFGKLF